MGLGERTPLRGSQEQVPPYVFMTDPNRAYKKKVRQLQCYLCSSILGVFLLALLVSVVYSVDSEEVEEAQGNDTLALSLKSQPHLKLKKGFPSVTELQDEEELTTAIHKTPIQNALKQDIDSGNQNPLTKLSIFDPCLEDSALKYECPGSRYRSVEGICNSQTHPLTWGVADRPFKRLLPTDYCDGNDSPRCSSLKSELPSSLEVGSALSGILEENFRDNNVIHMLWARFIFQDLVQTFPSNEEDEAECCSDQMIENTTCFPMKISRDSSSYWKYNRTCIPFSRSTSVICREGKRMQLNKATSFLDGSILYGSKMDDERKIRKFEGGLLTLYITPENKYLPIDMNEKTECNISRNSAQEVCKNQEYSCISHNMNLPSVNLMMAKHHNFIASQLRSINPQWSDEEIFQNARRIVIAQIQHITYNEFIESALGNDLIKTYGDNSETGYYEEYNANVDATVSEAFLLTFQLLTSFLPVNGIYLEKNNKTKSCNLNILGSQIQRGRDHGIPAYTRWREYCGLKKVTTFQQLNQELGADTVQSLKLLYQNVEDIDLIAGLIAEMPKVGNILGTIGSCIVSEQFKRTKTGDRFWFETSQKPQAFTRDQLDELHKTSLSRIICNNSKNLTRIQYNVMKETEENPSLICHVIPSLNLTLWDDNISNSLKTFNYYNHDDYAPSSIKVFMKSANDFILQSSKGKLNVTKRSTSFTVNIVNATLRLQNEIIYETFDDKPPYTIPLDSIADQNSYTPSAYTTFSAEFNEDILEGSLTLPVKQGDTFQKTKQTIQVNFTAGIAIKWGGSLVLEPKRKYNCKIMFQSYAKKSTADTQMTKSDTAENIHDKLESDEQCNLLLVGNYYQRPFYCSITPWWCLEGLIFYWSGEAKLIFVKPNPTVQKSLKTLNNVENTDKFHQLLGKTGNEVVEKTFASVTIINGKISGQFNGEEAMTLFEGSPPIDIPLDNIINPNSFDTSLIATWSATPIDDSTIIGEFSIPYFPTIGGENTGRRKLSANFSVDVIYKYGGSIGIIVPGKTYKCKTMFQGNKKLFIDDKLRSVNSEEHPISIKGKTPFGESCSITISGSFYEPSIFCKITPWWCSKEKIFHWSGDIELALKYKYNGTSEDNLKTSIKTDKYAPQVSNTNIKRKSIDNKNKILGKSDNTVVTKTFASVTVMKGKVTGNFNGEEPQLIMDSSPPIDINLDNFVNPNSFDTSVEATWSATPVDDNFISGTFSLPYYPSTENFSERRKFTANFSIDVIYKYGGSIEIIDPSKTYTCKVMFQANKKSSANSKLLHSSVHPVPLKGKTPFGESCSITISGSFHEPSVFCYLTPWWCSKAKIFHWNGDIELALKYKHNSTESIEINALKTAVQKEENDNENSSNLYQTYPQEGYCCGHRFGGKVISGWIQTKTGGLFSSSKTVWSGEIPFEVQLPVFWAPTNDDTSELSNVYSHAVLWTSSLFHSTIQGSFSFPQYIGHGSSQSMRWINGKFSFTLEANPYISLYDLIVPGIQYRSNVHFHNKHSPNDTSFLNSKTGDPTQKDVDIGIRAPIILLGRYIDSKHFIWNGTFVMDFSRSAKDLYYG